MCQMVRSPAGCVRKRYRWSRGGEEEIIKKFILLPGVYHSSQISAVLN